MKLKQKFSQSHGGPLDMEPIFNQQQKPSLSPKIMTSAMDPQ
jgi:hypothetical protein